MSRIFKRFKPETSLSEASLEELIVNFVMAPAVPRVAVKRT